LSICGYLVLHFQHLAKRRFRVHSARTRHIRDVLDFDISTLHPHHPDYTAEIGSSASAASAASPDLCTENTYGFGLCFCLIIHRCCCRLNRRTWNDLGNRTGVVGGINLRNNCSVA
jgi:hypothetical protein